MATSAYRGFVDHSSTRQDTERPVDVAALRAAVENCRYVCEAGGQVRIKWLSMRTADELLLDAGGLTINVFYKLQSFHFDAHLHPSTDGLFAYRIRLAGRAPQSAASKFRLIIGPADFPLDESNVSDTTPYTHIAEFSTSSNTAAWLSEVDSKTLLTVPSDRTPDAFRRQLTVTTIGGTTETNVTVVRMEAQVWASTSNLANPPALNGLLVEEYLGL